MEITVPKQEQAELLSELALRSKSAWGYDNDFLGKCRSELTYTAEDIQAPDKHFFIIKEVDEVFGFVCTKDIEDNKALLDDLFVDPEHLNRGYGTKLLDAAIKDAKTRGVTTLHIESDPNAAGFYERHGATQIGKVPSGSIPGRFLPLYELSI